MREYIERGRDGRWYAVRESEYMIFDTTGPVRVRRRVPMEPFAPRETAEYVARMMGLLDKEDK